MYSGYRMAEKDLATVSRASRRVRGGEWRFLAIEPAMTAPNEDDAAATELERVLAAGKNRFFRHWRLAGGMSPVRCRRFRAGEHAGSPREGDEPSALTSQHSARPGSHRRERLARLSRLGCGPSPNPRIRPLGSAPGQR